MNTNTQLLAHERDPRWLIALWLAVHGGDPAHEESQRVVSSEQFRAAAAGAISAIAGYLSGGAPSTGVVETDRALAHPALAALGIEYVPFGADKPQPDPWAARADLSGAEVRPMTCVRAGSFGSICWPDPPHHPLQ